MFSKIENEDNTLTLLDDFEDDRELEDPFKYGTEEIMKDILEDDLVRRSVSKISNNKSFCLLDLYPAIQEEDKQETSEVASSFDDQSQSHSQRQTSFEVSIKNINHSYSSFIKTNDRSFDGEANQSRLYELIDELSQQLTMSSQHCVQVICKGDV